MCADLLQFVRQKCIIPSLCVIGCQILYRTWSNTVQTQYLLSSQIQVNVAHCCFSCLRTFYWRVCKFYGRCKHLFFHLINELIYYYLFFTVYLFKYVSFIYCHFSFHFFHTLCTTYFMGARRHGQEGHLSPPLEML